MLSTLVALARLAGLIAIEDFAAFVFGFFVDLPAVALACRFAGLVGFFFAARVAVVLDFVTFFFTMMIP